MEFSPFRRRRRADAVSAVRGVAFLLTTAQIIFENPSDRRRHAAGKKVVVRTGPHVSYFRFCAGLGAAWFCVLSSPAARAEDELRPLGADVVVTLSIDVPPAQSIVLRVDQFGIDAVFDVRTNGAAEPYTVDQPT